MCSANVACKRADHGPRESQEIRTCSCAVVDRFCSLHVGSFITDPPIMKYVFVCGALFDVRGPFVEDRFVFAQTCHECV